MDYRLCPLTMGNFLHQGSHLILVHIYLITVLYSIWHDCANPPRSSPSFTLFHATLHRNISDRCSVFDHGRGDVQQCCSPPSPQNNHCGYICLPLYLSLFLCPSMSVLVWIPLMTVCDPTVNLEHYFLERAQVRSHFLDRILLLKSEPF